MKVHEKTVRRMILSGKLPAAKVGRSWVLLTRDVLSHIEKSIIEQTSKRLLGSSPKRVRKRRSAKIGVSHQHSV